jgi:hypothetical protein
MLPISFVKKEAAVTGSLYDQLNTPAESQIMQN